MARAMGYTSAVVEADAEERTHLIAARARRLLMDEEAEWIGYCHPGCPYCVVEQAREQLDEERGWATTDESRATSEVAMQAAIGLVDADGIHERTR